MPRNHPTDTPAGGGSSAPVRINKALAMAGVCSRRAADELVAQGLVAVNGQTVTEAGTKVDPARDRITVRGEAVGLDESGPEALVYVLLNKPTQVVTTASDPQGRKTVLDLLPGEFSGVRLFPVGRLDFFSQGLILLTNDGELANRLTHPRWHLPKVYRVTVRGDVSDRALDIMRGGMTLAEGEKLAPVEVTVAKRQAGTVQLEMTLIQGLNRQIRRMCRDLRLTVLRLERVAQGPVSLGKLREGQARALSSDEVAALYRAVGLEPQTPVKEDSREPRPAPKASKTARSRPGGGKAPSGRGAGKSDRKPASGGRGAGKGPSGPRSGAPPSEGGRKGSGPARGDGRKPSRKTGPSSPKGKGPRSARDGNRSGKPRRG